MGGYWVASAWTLERMALASCNCNSTWCLLWCSRWSHNRLANFLWRHSRVIYSSIRVLMPERRPISVWRFPHLTFRFARKPDAHEREMKHGQNCRRKPKRSSKNLIHTRAMVGKHDRRHTLSFRYVGRGGVGCAGNIFHDCNCKLSRLFLVQIRHTHRYFV